MNIAIISQYFYPEEFKINEISSELVKKGHSVFVLTGLPNYPTGVVPKEYRWKHRVENYQGVEVLRNFVIPRGKNPVSLILNYISFVISSSIKVLSLNKKREVNIILVYQLSPITMALPALLLKKLSGKKVLLYCLDLWPESIVTVTKKRKGVLYNSIRKLSSYIYRNVDRITVSSESFIDYLSKEHGVNSNSIAYLPQHHSRLTTDLKTRHEGFNFLYAGNIGKSQGVDWIVKAVNSIPKSFKYKIHIFGDGSERQNIEKLVKDYESTDYFIFHGHVSQDVVNEFYPSVDVCLLTLKSETEVGKTLPSKLIGYLSAGKPIIALIDDPAKELIIRNNCGWAANAGDIHSLATYMMESMDNKEQLLEMGNNSHKLYESNFTKEIFIDRIEAMMKTMIGDKHV